MRISVFAYKKMFILSLRSGTEEEFTELNQLCEDILAFRRDTAELKKKEKQDKKKKEEEDRKKGEEIRKAAVGRLAS